MEHGLVRLVGAQGDALLDTLKQRAAAPNCPESLGLLLDVLESQSTEYQAQRLRRLGGVAIKDAKRGDVDVAVSDRRLAFPPPASHGRGTRTCCCWGASWCTL